MRLKAFLTENKQENNLFISFSKFKDKIKPHLSKVEFCEWSDISLEDGTIKVNDKKLKDFNFIFVNISSKHEKKISLVIDYIEKNNIKNLQYGSFKHIDNKLLQHKKFKEEKHKHPKTTISTKDKVSVEDLEKKIGYPIVIKPSDGSQRKGIEKIEDRDALQEFISSGGDEDFIFQEFLENSGECNLFFFKDELVYIEDDKQVPKSVIGFAKKVSSSFGFDFCRVKLVESKGQWNVLKIDANPELGSEYFESILKYIKR